MVLGFRGFDCRDNLHYLNDGTDIVYHAAGAGVVLNLSTGEIGALFQLITTHDNIFRDPCYLQEGSSHALCFLSAQRLYPIYRCLVLKLTCHQVS